MDRFDERTRWLLAEVRRPGLRAALDAGDDALAAWVAAAAPPRTRAPRRRPLSLLAGLLLAVGALWAADVQLGPGLSLLATVNGKPVTRQALLENLEQELGARAAETTVIQEAVQQAAEKASLAPTEADIDATLARLKQELFRGSDEAYTGWLKLGHRESTLRREVATQVAQYRLRTQTLKPTDAELRQHWEQHKEVYQRPESYIYRIIHCPWPTRDNRRVPPPQALASARELLAKVIRAPQDFEALAREVSEEPSAPRTGGRIGPQWVDLVPPVVMGAIKDLSPNQVAPEPVPLGDRYVLLQFLAHLPAVDGAFENVREQVRLDFVSDKLPPQRPWLQHLLAEQRIELKDPRYHGLRLSGRWTSPSQVGLPGWLSED